MDEGCLTPRNIEEPAARCNICGSGLSITESLVYGNRCLFCSEEKKNISLLDFFQHCLLDFFIYRRVLSWKELFETCEDCQDGKISQMVSGDDIDVSDCTSCNGTGEKSIGRLKMIGFVGSVGAAYYNELTIKQKWELLKELK